MTDAELLRSVQAGDLLAWEQLYPRYLPTVWRYVYLQAGGDSHLAEDVVSETVLALVRQVSSLAPGDGNLSGWLIAVARNKLGDHWRNVARGTMAAKAASEGDISGAAGGGPEVVAGGCRNPPAGARGPGSLTWQGTVGIGVEVSSKSCRSAKLPAGSGGRRKRSSRCCTVQGSRSVRSSIACYRSDFSGGEMKDL